MRPEQGRILHCFNVKLLAQNVILAANWMPRGPASTEEWISDAYIASCGEAIDPTPRPVASIPFTPDRR